MLQIATKNKNAYSSDLIMTTSPDLSRVRVLVGEESKEVLDFLSIRPVHTVVMTSFILDNGLTSELNRGTFYGYWNGAGDLEGVALIGHTTLVEARSEEAMKALAFTARTSAQPIHLIMSGGDAATSFWNYLYGGSRKPSLACTELLFEVGFPFPVQACSYQLRLARPEELEGVAVAHAEVAEIECGVNPMDRDRDGFLSRTLRRINQDRVFVVYEGEKLVFKADIVAETDTAAYIEGVYVSPEFRGRGVGAECLSGLCLELLSRFETVCLLSNAEFTGAHRSFRRAGMQNTGSCTTLFV